MLGEVKADPVLQCIRGTGGGEEDKESGENKVDIS